MGNFWIVRDSARIKKGVQVTLMPSSIPFCLTESLSLTIREASACSK